VEREIPSVFIPRLGTFTGHDDGSVATIDPDVPEQDAVEAYFRSVLPLFLQRHQHEVLHGSAIVVAGGVVAFCASSGTGKSTLAIALAGRGYTPWADDAVAWRLDEGKVISDPLPFRLRNDLVNRRELEQREGPLPLRTIFVLERAAVREPEAILLAPREAFSALLPHAYCFAMNDRTSKMRLVQHHAVLANSVPVRRLRFSPGADSLPSLVDRLIEEFLQGGRGSDSAC
jgi:hypothetical protein